MKQFLSACLFVVMLSCDGQTETPKKNFLPGKLVDYYNQKQYDSIFFLFSPDMKTALPAEQTKAFFSQLQEDAGNIRSYEFKDKKESYDRYKAYFSKGIYWLSISQNAMGKIEGLYVTEYDSPGEKSTQLKNTIPLSLPFSGEWFVFWGGDTKEQNYHVISQSQKNAFDLVIVDQKGQTFKTNGLTNEDFYAFGQPLLAPCDAEVVSVVEGVKDNIPGEMNSGQVTGNTVVLKIAANEYLLFAHFKQNSIAIKKGDLVKKGQLLGLCGNSGNSSEPHLHFHIQDKEDMFGATGIKCYFEKILVNGVETADHSPVRGEKIKNIQ